MLHQVGNTAVIGTFGASALRLRLFDGPLDLAWKHCGITSDFLGNFYSAHVNRDTSGTNEIRHNVTFLANEILENAVKFKASGDIAIDTSVEDGRFRLCVANLVSEERALRFQEILRTLEGRDPSELMIERIEQNAADPTERGSGLGLLSLMSDYDVQLGWDFRKSAKGDGTIRLGTYAVLPLA